MIINLHKDGFALMTDVIEDKERFIESTVQSASKDNCQEALESIPENEIKQHPEGFRQLAVEIALGRAFVGYILPENLQP